MAETETRTETTEADPGQGTTPPPEGTSVLSQEQAEAMLGKEA